MPKIFIVVLLLCATVSLHSRSSYDASRLIIRVAKFGGQTPRGNASLTSPSAPQDW
jgi:hypothetical protein